MPAKDCPHKNYTKLIDGSFDQNLSHGPLTTGQSNLYYHQSKKTTLNPSSSTNICFYVVSRLNRAADWTQITIHPLVRMVTLVKRIAANAKFPRERRIRGVISKEDYSRGIVHLIGHAQAIVAYLPPEGNAGRGSRNTDSESATMTPNWVMFCLHLSRIS